MGLLVHLLCRCHQKGASSSAGSECGASGERRQHSHRQALGSLQCPSLARRNHVLLLLAPLGKPQEMQPPDAAACHQQESPGGVHWESGPAAMGPMGLARALHQPCTEGPCSRSRVLRAVLLLGIVCRRVDSLRSEVLPFHLTWLDPFEGRRLPCRKNMKSGRILGNSPRPGWGPCPEAGSLMGVRGLAACPVAGA